MLLEDKLTVMINGKEVECDVVVDFSCNENGKNYVVFTDHSTDDDGIENVYVRSYDPFKEEVEFEDVTTDAEWNMVSEVLNSIKNGEV